MREQRLAAKWPISKVENCLRAQRRADLARFLKDRHAERFFTPIRQLQTAKENEQGFGFAFMALCSLLVETIHSYRLGLPSTSSGDLKRMRANSASAPRRYRVSKGQWPSWVEDVFVCFFQTNATFFSGIDGSVFYHAIRNALLHQAQTRNGWRIRKDGKLWGNKMLNRDLFVRALENCFECYIQELRQLPWRHPTWQNAARKLWWLCRLSK
jgi:hypothetical protein